MTLEALAEPAHELALAPTLTGQPATVSIVESKPIIVDASHWQGHLDMAAIKAAGVVGVIHKVTQGLSIVDRPFAARRAAAKAVGLMWGEYAFCTGTDGAAQADFLLNTGAPTDDTLLMLDFELNTKGASMTANQALQFIQRIEEKTGRSPVFYGGFSYINQHFGTHKNDVLARCPFMLASYTHHPQVPASWPDWTFWQYTNGTDPEVHITPGVGRCDRSRFNGDLAGLRKLWNVE